MKRIWILGLLFSVFGVTTLYCQKSVVLSKEEFNQLSVQEDALELLAYSVVNDTSEANRFQACKQLIKGLKTALEIPNSFQYPFGKIKSFSILYPPDSSFRVFTWQLYVDIDEYRYYGAIQMNKTELQLFPLIDRSHEREEGYLESMQLLPNQWYGALYYNIEQVEIGKEYYYLLFGYDGYRFYHKRKLIDVLSFNEEGPLFGLPVFEKEKQNQNLTYHRIVLEYSAETSIRLNYDPDLEMIVFDHLIPLKGNYGEGLTYLPDGSYEGYKLSGGKWIHVDKVFTQVQETPLLPDPILDARPKDILGRPKN